MDRLKVNVVKPDGYADSIGVKNGDILLSLGNIPLDSPNALTDTLAALAGKPTDLVFLRDGNQQSVVVESSTLGVVVAPVGIDDLLSEADRTAKLAGLIVSTTPSIEGYKVTRTVDVITAECVFGLNFFKDFFTSLTDIFGGRSNTAQSALREARRNCLNELKKEALMLGANAVIGISLDYSEFSGQGKSMLFLVASGTAVVIEPIT